MSHFFPREIKKLHVCYGIIFIFAFISRRQLTWLPLALLATDLLAAWPSGPGPGSQTLAQVCRGLNALRAPSGEQRTCWSSGRCSSQCWLEWTTAAPFQVSSGESERVTCKCVCVCVCDPQTHFALTHCLLLSLCLFWENKRTQHPAESQKQATPSNNIEKQNCNFPQSKLSEIRIMTHTVFINDLQRLF